MARVTAIKSRNIIRGIDMLICPPLRQKLGLRMFQ